MKDAAARLWQRDVTLWKNDPNTPEIGNRLGWLDSPKTMSARVDEIQGFAARVKQAGFTNAFLLGMGGSSLAPEVFHNVYGAAQGDPDLHVIDTTNPATIARLEHQANLDTTLFINASKSGTTIEPASLASYFWQKRPKGDQFVAITDPGTQLDQHAEANKYRHIFRNDPNIGGRYAALSYFGLAPAALVGVDIGRLLASAREAARQNSPGAAPDAPKSGIALGQAIGRHALEGKNKLTFVLSPRIADFGNWVEQLIAESTGKENKGVLPVVGEPLGDPSVYGNDRVFAALVLESDLGPWLEPRREALVRNGHPFYTLVLHDEYDLGAEFFRWEVATAICGAALGINPFDQPNVAEAKTNTAKLLEQFQSQGKFVQNKPQSIENLTPFLSGSVDGDYVAILAFIDRNPHTIGLLANLQATIRNTTKRATTAGFGPRYLHSTGQLHKGGPNSGLFVLITSDEGAGIDAPIPGQPFDFGTLFKAQALGDLQALKSHGRRVIHLHLGRNVNQGLEEVTQAASRLARAAR